MLSGIVAGVTAGCSYGSMDSLTEIVLNKAISWQMGWLVTGNQGMLLHIQTDGTAKEIETGALANLNDICYDGKNIWIVGDGGIVLKGTKELNFERLETDITEDLEVCQYFSDNIYFGGDGSVLWSIDTDGAIKPCNVKFSGTMVDMEASDEHCIFVTDTGDAVSTSDGVNWSVLSYGDYYGKEAEFQGLIYDSNSFWAYGITEEGTELFYTSSGAAWGERNINYLDGEEADLSDTKILSMTTDGQQLYAWCEDGVMLTIPECVKCNKKTEVSDIQGGIIGYNGGNLLMISDLSKMKIMETELAKQYQISAETAYTRTQEGAVIIDVRTLEDYEDKHIRGSVCIPLEELTEKLPELYPDIGQRIIFYCTKGVRSQTAVEKAVELGYVEVYSLGSMENWTYEFE